MDLDSQNPPLIPPFQRGEATEISLYKAGKFREHRTVN